jgi:hypothetical protein
MGKDRKMSVGPIVEKRSMTSNQERGKQHKYNNNNNNKRMVTELVTSCVEIGF